MTVYPNDCPEDISSNTILTEPEEEPTGEEEPEYQSCADSDCYNHIEVPVIKNIFFKTYEFCSEICAEEFEDHLRDSYKKSRRTTK